jgi:hypothetical protein
MKKVFNSQVKFKKTCKKTRQGMSNNTKYGTKISNKYYKKQSRGQG